MIARYRPPASSLSDDATERRLRRARLAVARSLFDESGENALAPPVAAWKAWLLVGWATTVAIGYFFILVRMGS